ncbi:hypothetical protein [Brevundimonas sp.]|jgi:hypothetical protein|uniref:hypothetical protein n=1 Tax=Brevundimonas sp. TaxID=1871086 RepID=UPI002EDBB36C
MTACPDRSLCPENFTALKAEVIRAAVELSDAQLMELSDTLHSMIRLRRPGRPISDDAGWMVEAESPYLP